MEGSHIASNRNEIGKTLKQQRLMLELTLRELAARSGVSASHLARVERGERFPSGHVLRKLTKPLGLVETELLTIAGYLSPDSETGEEYRIYKELDPYVAKVLSEEPVEVQRTVIAILTILKSIAKGSGCDIEFREYVRRQYPELDEDIITMFEDIIKRGQG